MEELKTINIEETNKEMIKMESSYYNDCMLESINDYDEYILNSLEEIDNKINIFNEKYSRYIHLNNSKDNIPNEDDILTINGECEYNFQIMVDCKIYNKFPDMVILDFYKLIEDINKIDIVDNAYGKIGVTGIVIKIEINYSNY